VNFKNWGGNMGAAGSVSFMFKRMGVFRLDPTGIDQEALELDSSITACRSSARAPARRARSS